MKQDKIKVVISDCHLSAGRFFEDRLNPHEDFHFDDQMCAMFEHFSTGEYGDHRDVELILAGDYLDFLNVPYRAEFEDAITEEIALYKLEAIIKGHPKVMAALRSFASKPKKKIIYLIGNHDAELFYEKVRKRIVMEWDPNASHSSDSVQVIADQEKISYPGVEIHHGCQHEVGSELNFENPMTKTFSGKKILNLPWGSIYVLKIINRLKWEREHVDKVRPVKVFVVFGLLFDPIFTLKFCFLTSYYFFKTRLGFLGGSKSFKLSEIWKSFKQETKFFQDLEEEARLILDESPDVKTVIFGHTHRPMDRVYPDGKQYINTGTWTRMIQVDWAGFGQSFRRTFALVRLVDGHAECELRQWVGEHGPHQIFSG